LGRRKRKQKKKSLGQHQRIYIRRSIRSGRLKGIVGGLEGSSFYESLSLILSGRKSKKRTPQGST